MGRVSPSRWTIKVPAWEWPFREAQHDRKIIVGVQAGCLVADSCGRACDLWLIQCQRPGAGLRQVRQAPAGQSQALSSPSQLLSVGRRPRRCKAANSIPRQPTAVERTAASAKRPCRSGTGTVRRARVDNDVGPGPLRSAGRGALHDGRSVHGGYGNDGDPGADWSGYAVHGERESYPATNLADSAAGKPRSACWFPKCHSYSVYIARQFARFSAKTFHEHKPIHYGQCEFRRRPTQYSGRRGASV